MIFTNLGLISFSNILRVTFLLGLDLHHSLAMRKNCNFFSGNETTMDLTTQWFECYNKIFWAKRERGGRVCKRETMTLNSNYLSHGYCHPITNMPTNLMTHLSNPHSPFHIHMYVRKPKTIFLNIFFHQESAHKEETKTTWIAIKAMVALFELFKREKPDLLH